MFRPLLHLLPVIGLVPAGAVAQSAAPGRVVGSVELRNDVAPRRPRIRVYGDGAAPARAQPGPASELANVVVYLASPAGAGSDAGSAAPPAGRISVAQENEMFVPHIVAVRRGATVAFPNRDPVFHNVFSLSAAKSFDLGRYPRGESRSVTFDRSGIVQVFCHIHSDMSAVILVLDDPWFVTVGRDGRFTISDVPPGEYRLVAWHERVEPVERMVRVPPGGVVDVGRLSLPVVEEGATR